MLRKTSAQNTRYALGRRDMLRLLTLAAVAALPMPAGADEEKDASDLIGQLQHYITDGQETLLDVARQYDLGILEVSAANPGIDVWVPGKDTLVLLPAAHILPDAPRRGIVINKSELRLYYFLEKGPVETHAIGVGREGFSTPVGATRIVRKQANPTWYPTADTRRDRPELPSVVGPGPENPLGDRALYLGWPTYLIHGTNKPYGVGRRVSRGCIRMYPEAVERLFEQVAIGTPVTVVEQPVKAGWRGGELYLEVHPDLSQLDELEETYSFDFGKEPATGGIDIVRAKAGDAVDRVQWNVVDAELIARRGVPVRITADRVASAGGTASPRGSGEALEAGTGQRSLTGLY